MSILCETATRKAVDNFREHRREFFGFRAHVRAWDKRMDDYEAEIALGEAVGFDVEQLCEAARKALRMRVAAALRVHGLRPAFVKRLAEHRSRVKSFRDIRDANIRMIRHERAKSHGART